MKMKIIYKFADGSESVVEVEEEIGQAIIVSRREEENYERKMRYHCPVSIDKLEYEGMQFADPDTPMSLLENEIEEQEQKELINYVMSQLTETQRRIQMKADGLTLEEIARIEGVHFTTIDESIKAAQKKANKLREKYFKKF
ncbi:putative uncharacterized protein [Staphylococcus sp. CAG:324]|jgi:hypothetical protein|nr:hypothetical protein [Staphylococcus sp.]CDC68958.1 putative uncharacterized protein [Staphylococcus sp. CAG:324]